MIDPQTRVIIRSVVKEFLQEVAFYIEQEGYPFGMAVEAAEKSFKFEESLKQEPKDG